MTIIRHWSGYRGNEPELKDAREMCDAFLRLGFSPEATKWLAQQGLKKPEKLRRQTDATIDSYIYTCRKPGGGKQGHVCPMDAVALLKLTVWGAKHMDRISRSLEPEDITEDWCESWCNQIDLEKNWDNEVATDDYPKCDNASKKPGKFFEDLETLLGRMRGVTGIPLLRVVRQPLIPEDADDDPRTGTPDSEYLTLDDEMTARAPIILEDEENIVDDDEEQEKAGPFDPVFLQDRKKVWTILCAICHGSHLYVHIKRFRVKTDGRGAWFSLKDFLLGKDHVARTVRELETTLKTLSYKGEGRRFNFAKYRTAHTEQHDIAESLMEHDFPGLSMDQKIQYFLDGIKTNTLEVAKATVRANPDLKNDFHKCAMYLQDIVQASPPTFDSAGGGTPRGVSQLRTGGRTAWKENEVDALIPTLKQKYSRDGARFYIPADVYKSHAFTAAHKQAAFRIREEIKKSGGSKPGGAGGGKGGEAGASNRTIKVLTSSIEALTSTLTNANDENSDDDEDEGSKRMASDSSTGSKRSNQGHPALCRPEKQRKK
jgi:hypothetical protein